MSTELHRKDAPKSVRCFVLTISDTRTPASDTSGTAIATALEGAGHEVVGRQIVRDEPGGRANAVTAATGNAQVIITTGGTGITSRDSTYEAIASLLDKRLDGFGELFRMLSYEEIGSAAMMSRACAGTIGTHGGLRAAGLGKRRPAGADKLILPELGHVVRELAAMTTMRPIRETIPLDEARALLMARGASDRAAPSACRFATRSGRVLAADAIVRDRRARRSTARRWTATRCIAEDTFGAGRYDAKVLRCIEKVYTGAGAVARGSRPANASRSRPARRCPMAPTRSSWSRKPRRRGRSATSGSSRRCIRGRTSGARAADIAAGQPLLAAGTLLNPSRIGALAAIGVIDVDVFASPRVAILSTGNEIVEPGQPLGPGQIYDINRFTLSRSFASTAACRSPAPQRRTTSTRSSAAIRRARGGRHRRVFRRQLRRRARSDPRRAAGSAARCSFTASRSSPASRRCSAGSAAKPVFGMPGYPTSCLSNAYMLLVPLLRRMARLPEHRPQTCACRSRGAIVSTTGRHQFYTVRIVDGAAVPAFKASGDITSMSHADGYIEIPAQTDIVEAGEIVEVKLF